MMPKPDTIEDFIGLPDSSSSSSSESESEPENKSPSTQKPISRKRKARNSDSDCILSDPSDTEAPSKTQNQKKYQLGYNGRPLPPWLQGRKRLGHGKRPAINEILNEEMKHFIDYISPTAEEHQMREWVLMRIQRAVDSMKLEGIDAKVKCFGSFNTMLYLPTSDIDVTVMLYEKQDTGKPGKISRNYESKEAIRRFLYTLVRVLKTTNFCTRSQVIAKARVPIIKTHESITGVAIDISVNADSGMNSSMVQRSFSNHVYPKSLRAIVLVIKQFLSQRSMNEVYTGGLGSYAITLLVVSFLQIHPRCQSKSLDLYENLGVLLLEFFELYGKRFNYENVGISVRENGRYFAKVKSSLANYSNYTQMLVLEDPCDTTNDVARGTFGMNRIKQTFAGAYDLLTNEMYAYHQTRKFARPINENLFPLAATNYNEHSSRYSTHQSSSKYRKISRGVHVRSSDAEFNSDPYVPVSFLASILHVDSSAISAREKIAAAFYDGRMQRVLGVEYQPQLSGLLPGGNEDSSESEDKEDKFLESLKRTPSSKHTRFEDAEDAEDGELSLHDLYFTFAESDHDD